MRPVWSHVFFVSVTVAYNNCGIFKKWIICRFDCEHIYLSIVRAPLEISGRDRLLIVKLNKTYTGVPQRGYISMRICMKKHVNTGS